jgi:neopullulanase
MPDAAPPDWIRDAVFYQIFPDRFASSSRVPKPGSLEPWDAPPTVHGFKGGDLLGIVERLDYLEALGINAIYLNPIFASASNHRYHTYDYMAVDPLLGGDAALRELLDAAHARGMKVVLDGVFNHASRGFWPFHHVLEAGGASPYRDWFYLNPKMLDAGQQLRAYPSEVLSGALDPDWGAAHRLGDRSLDELGYRAWWDLPALPKLNVANPHMREYLLQVAEHWIRFGADGWRLDVAEEIGDAAFWAEFRHRVRTVNPEAYIVGEIWRLAPDWIGADRFDAVMNYPLAWRILGFAAGRHLDLSVAAEQGHVRSVLHPLEAPAFGRQVEEVLAAYEPESLVAQLNMLDSHDTPRALTLCGGDETSLRLCLLLMLSMPGAPSVYYGDEVGMAGHADPDSRRAFDWTEESWNLPLLDFVRRSIAVRQATPALRSAAVRMLACDGMAVVLARTDRASTALVAVNAGESEAVVELGAGDLPSGAPVLLVGPSPTAVSASDGLRLTLPPRCGAIWSTAA